MLRKAGPTFVDIDISALRDFEDYLGKSDSSI